MNEPPGDIERDCNWKQDNTAIQARTELRKNYAFFLMFYIYIQSGSHHLSN